MLVAAVDTSTLTLSCALVELRPSGASLLAERTEHAPARPPPGGPAGGHGAKLPGALRDLLVAADLKLPDIEGYAVGLGPGSFTGLRIGLATWKGLAYANRRPIAGASSLAAMAAQAAEQAPAGALLGPLLDARKGEVYAGFYRAAGGRVEAARPEAALSPSALADLLGGLGAAGHRPVEAGVHLALPGVEERHEERALLRRRGGVERHGREARDAGDGPPVRVGEPLPRGEADAQPGERAGAEADGVRLDVPELPPVGGEEIGERAGEADRVSSGRARRRCLRRSPVGAVGDEAHRAAAVDLDEGAGERQRGAVDGGDEHPAPGPGRARAIP